MRSPQRYSSTWTHLEFGSSDGIGCRIIVKLPSEVVAEGKFHCYSADSGPGYATAPGSPLVRCSVRVFAREEDGNCFPACESCRSFHCLAWTMQMT
jgi:hypothetical protein